MPVMTSEPSSFCTYAACVSFSSSILRSSTIITRSFSTNSSLTRSLCSSVERTCVSSRTAASSRSLSVLVRSVSRVKLSPSSIASDLWLKPISSFSFDMSVCIAPILFCRSSISFFCWFTCPSTRMRFCTSTAVCALISPTRSLCDDASLDNLTNSVCVLIHMRCKSLHVFRLASISLRRLLIVASSGPDTAASAPAACSSLARNPSNLRLSVSRSRIFFSISSFLRRISTSYFSTRTSLRLSSRSMSLTVALSWSLCASVLSASTLMRDNSLRTCASSFSLACMCCCMPCVCLSVLCADFCSVVCSASDCITASSILCVSFCVLISSLSTLPVCSVTTFFSCSTDASSASDCSSERLSTEN
mmetsp:Transcript_5446/g.8798  ORF Transcript_5446/g.8798 Transcript_5446/m.8798 type:complete len:362 (-) Transcript_5446:1219-2304(-)